MLGTRWRVGATVGLLAVALTGCGFITGDTTPTKSTDPAAEVEAIKQRENKLSEAYNADIAANQARDTAVIYCGNLSFKDLTSPKCKAEAQRTELFQKSRDCMTAIDAYNAIRGPENKIVKFQTTNPRRKNQWITCAFDK